VVPSTTGAVFAFALFVAPGLLFDLLASRRRAGEVESTFREVSRVVLASTAFTTLSAIAVGMVGLLLIPVNTAKLVRLMTTDSPGTHSLAELTLPAITVSALACGLAGVTHLALSRGRSPLRKTSAWTRVLREEVPPQLEPYVRVRLSNGASFAGFVGSYSPDLQLSGRELVLVPPLMSGRDGRWSAVEQWERVVLRSDDIVSLLVQYRPPPDQIE
jgi:hypothetical protein